MRPRPCRVLDFPRPDPGSAPRRGAPPRKETALSATARTRRPKTVTARAAAVAAARAMDAMKAEDVVVLDVGEVSPITEHFVLATGSNPRHVKAVADEAVRALKEMGIRPSSVDGAEQGSWAVVDYGPLVLHVFLPEARKYYDLEILWGDGRKVRWKAPARRPAK